MDNQWHLSNHSTLMKALVFSGEGSKGGYQAGIALAQQGPFDLVLGTSSGAINAVGYAYLGPSQLVNMWRSITKRSQIFSIDLWGLIKGNGFYSPAPLRALLGNVIFNNRPSCEVVITRINDETGMCEYVSNVGMSAHLFLDAVIDAVSIPVIVNNPDGYIDGAEVTDLPLSYAIKRGATDLTAILGTPPIPTVAGTSWPIFDIVNRGARFVELLLNQIMFDNMAMCVIQGAIPKILGPTQFLFDPLDFTKVQSGLEMALQGQYSSWIYQAGSWQVKP